MVDARDLKSLEDYFVRVRVPPRAQVPKIKQVTPAYALIAQLVEQLPLKEMVVGSNPTEGTEKIQIMINKIKNNTLDEVLSDLSVYSYPEIFEEKYIEKTSKNINIRILKKYSLLLYAVNSSWQKTLQYKFIFDEFYYESNNLNKFSQLEHHIHAYLQDMDTFKNKMEILFDNLKKDTKDKVVNQKDVLEFFTKGKEKIKEVFAKISKYRVPHVHQGQRFADGDILKAENTQRILDLFELKNVLEKLNSNILPEKKVEMLKDQEDYFNKAKIRWVNIAINNDEQTTNFLEFMIKSIKPILYKVFDIVPLKDILQSRK